MSKLLKGSNSKFVVNLFKSFGIALSLVAVSSCSDKPENNGEGSIRTEGEQEKLNIDDVFKDVNSLKKAVSDVLDVDAADIQNVLKSFISEKNSFKNKTKAELIAALKARGVKEKQTPRKTEPGSENGLSVDLKKAVDAVKSATDADAVSKLEALKMLIVSSDPGAVVKKLISAELPCKVKDNKFVINEKVVIDNVSGKFNDYVKAVLFIRHWNSDCKISLKEAGSIDSLSAVGELKGISKDVFVSQIGFKKGSSANKIVFVVGNDSLGSEYSLNEDCIEKVGKLCALNPCLFVDGLIESSVVDNYSVENVNADVTLRGCDKVSSVKFDKIKGLVKSWKVSDVVGNGTKISFNINGKACGIRFDNFVNFASDCQKLVKLVGGAKICDTAVKFVFDGGKNIKFGGGTGLLLFKKSNNIDCRGFFVGFDILKKLGIGDMDTVGLGKNQNANTFSAGEGIKTVGNNFSCAKDGIGVEDVFGFGTMLDGFVSRGIFVKGGGSEVVNGPVVVSKDGKSITLDSVAFDMIS